MKIEIESVKKSYGKREILKDISLFANEGECIGIIGANGSGKSTFFAGLAGILKLDSGRFTVDGRDLLSDIPSIRKYVGYVPQGIPLFDELSAKDNLRFWYSKEELEKSLEGGMLSSLKINEFIDMRVSRLSGGMKKRLSIGCAVSGGPGILFMDEPTASLDLPGKAEVYKYMDDFRKGGRTVFIATHDETEIRLCDRCFLLKDGKLAPYSYAGDLEKLVKEL